MRIAIACDHIGFALKASVIEALEGEEHAVLDLGTHSPAPVEYPAMAKAVATTIGKGFVDLGILLCESGIGGARSMQLGPAPFDREQDRAAGLHPDGTP